MNNHQKWMAVTIKEAMAATKNGDAPVAAIIVQNDKILSVGRNTKTSALNIDLSTALTKRSGVDMKNILLILLLLVPAISFSIEKADYKATHISYPNDEDKMRAEGEGVSPGGQIMIHGQKNGFGWLSFIVQRFNWTDGWIALSNSDMDEVWESVEVGTPIIIKP